MVQDKMTTSKAGIPPIPQPSIECCMCGDYGLSNELFNCKVCQFRSQHRYCSNQYPKAESYRVCNWCLIQTEKTQNSSNSSSPNKNSSEDHDHLIKKKKKQINGGGSEINNGGLKGQKGSTTFQFQVSSPIKKQRSLEGSPAAAAARKRIITGNGGVEEKLTRTKSEEISNGGTITKQVFRNKVRRYKLLDEVSSQ